MQKRLSGLCCGRLVITARQLRHTVEQLHSASAWVVLQPAVNLHSNIHINKCKHWSTWNNIYPCAMCFLYTSNVCNLGVVTDSAMTFKPHVSSVVSSCYYQLRQMKSSLKLLPFDIASTVVNSFIINRIDYCNSLLANSTQRAVNRLQQVMNAAAQHVCHSGRMTPGLLHDRLHWLRVPERGS